MFRGREQSRPELGFRLLQRLADDVAELGFVEATPKQDGRNMIMVIAPHKKPSPPVRAAPAAADGTPRPESGPRRNRTPGGDDRAARERPGATAPREIAPGAARSAPAHPDRGATRERTRTMPKNKTHTGTKKRVKVTGTGKLLREQTRQAPPARGQVEHRTRRLTGTVVIATADVPRVKKLLGR